MSKSRKIHDLIPKQETRLRRNGDGGREIEEEVEFQCHVSLPNFPRRLEAFETAAKFCNGVKIDLSASNVAPLRQRGSAPMRRGVFGEDRGIFQRESVLEDEEVFFAHCPEECPGLLIKTLDSGGHLHLPCLPRMNREILEAII